MLGNTYWRTSSTSTSSLHGAFATKWCSDWRIGWMFSGSRRAAIGSMLLRPGCQQSFAVVLQRYLPVFVPRGFRQALYICRESSLLWAWSGKAGSHKTILQQNGFSDPVVLGVSANQQSMGLINTATSGWYDV
jgi:hypothetical protein